MGQRGGRVIRTFKKMARKLGIDLGRKSCGFAISDPENIYSLSLSNIHFKKDDFSEVLNAVGEILSNNVIDTIVLGLPLRDNFETIWTKKIMNFGKRLSIYFDIPVIFFDETNSTKQTQKTLIKLGVSRRRRKENKDKAAAALMLQNFLDSNRK